MARFGRFLAALLLAAAVSTAPAALAQQVRTVKGEILETQNVESYTYLRLKTSDGEIWAAVPTTAAKKGTQVTIGNAMTMENFESKTLKKKFDKIVFGQIIEPGAAPAAPYGAMPTGPAGGPVAKVPKASGPDAQQS